MLIPSSWLLIKHPATFHVGVACLASLVENYQDLLVLNAVMYCAASALESLDDTDSILHL